MPPYKFVFQMSSKVKKQSGSGCFFLDIRLDGDPYKRIPDCVARLESESEPLYWSRRCYITGYSYLYVDHQGVL